MTDLTPDMPEDWWPEILVMGKHDGFELAFAIVSQEGRDPSVLLQNLEGLRMAIWEAKHHPELRGCFG